MAWKKAKTKTINNAASNADHGRLSLIERLPTEIILMIDAEANNPWLAYASPLLHQILETSANRKRYVELAFKIFGTKNHKFWRTRSQPCVDYTNFFSTFASLPWFAKAVFDKKHRMMKPAKFRSWITISHGAFATLAPQAWNQALGDFASVVLKRYTVALGRLDCVKIARDFGLQRALHQGCIPAIEMLADCALPNRIATSIVETDSDTWTMPKYERWIRPWTEKKIVFSRPILPKQCHTDFAMALDLMRSVESETTTHERPECVKYIIQQFWAAYFRPGRSILRVSDRARDLKTMGDLLIHTQENRVRDNGFFDRIEDMVFEGALDGPWGLDLRYYEHGIGIWGRSSCWSLFDFLRRRGVYHSEAELTADRFNGVRIVHGLARMKMTHGGPEPV